MVGWCRWLVGRWVAHEVREPDFGFLLPRGTGISNPMHGDPSSRAGSIERRIERMALDGSHDLTPNGSLRGEIAPQPPYVTSMLLKNMF